MRSRLLGMLEYAKLWFTKQEGPNAPSLYSQRIRTIRTLSDSHIPTDETELIRLYTLSEQDLSAIRQRRGDANRLGQNPKLDRQSFFIYFRPRTPNGEAQLFYFTRNPSKND